MEKDNRANRYSPETRARAVRMVLENQGSYESQSAAIKAIAPKIGCGRDTLRRWVQQEETDAGRRDGVTTDTSPNSVRFSGGQVDTGTPGGASNVTVDKATLRFTATIQVAD